MNVVGLAPASSKEQYSPDEMYKQKELNDEHTARRGHPDQRRDDHHPYSHQDDEKRLSERLRWKNLDSK
jgi:hypothetical protein